MRGGIDVSIALLGGGDVISIVLLRGKNTLSGRVLFFLFVLGLLFFLLSCWGCFFLFFLFCFFYSGLFFYVVFRARCFQETENRISINKLDRRHCSPGLFVEALKLPIWKLKRQKCNSDTVYHFLKRKKMFSVCWKRQRCDKLKKKKLCKLYIVILCFSIDP